MSHSKHIGVSEPGQSSKGATVVGQPKKKLKTHLKAGMASGIVSNDLGPDNVQKKHVGHLP